MLSTLRWIGLLEFVLATGACAEPTSEGGEGSGSGESGADTTQESGDTGSNTENCGMHPLGSLQEDCQGIGSVQDLLDTAAGERTSTLAWSTYESVEITHVPASGSTMLTLRLHYDGGEAVCHHYCDPCPGLPCGAASEPARIEVDALVDLATDDGALADTFDVVATGDGYSQQVGYAGSIAPSSLAGTLEVELLAADFEQLAINLSGVLGDGVASGALAASAMHVDPAGPAITVPVATWPMP